MTKTITEFLAARNVNAEEFGTIIAHFGDKMERGGSESDDGRYYRGWSILDMKRFDDVVVVLEGHRSWGYTPGIRRSTFITVFVSGAMSHRREVNYVDGGYQTHHLDRPARDFREITSACQNGKNITVTIRNGDGAEESVVLTSSDATGAG